LEGKFICKYKTDKVLVQNIQQKTMKSTRRQRREGEARGQGERQGEGKRGSEKNKNTHLFL
jgi:hypothetical protein